MASNFRSVVLSVTLSLKNLHSKYSITPKLINKNTSATAKKSKRITFLTSKFTIRFLARIAPKIRPK
ncbi:hypothetical protein GCM10007894_08420 [Paraferrimonas haliotis]|uniref:Uncharacterized protein n=1 Tax=Paraferrimonas haliotis TaxID=2013866 RepID=A0AA37WXR2_9GAMM|nr:hypothetical protein GCM10007894_08420 [Paraferrimonas haliotis]